MAKYIALELKISYDFEDFDLWKSNFYDIENDCIVVDNYGHGQGPKITEYIDWKTAIDNNIVEVNKIVDAICKHLNICNYTARDFSSRGKMAFIPCSIVKGRKMKGDNKYLLCTILEHNTYMRRMYGSNYFDKEISLVYDPEKNQLCEVNPDYIELHYSSVDRIKTAVNKDVYYNLKKLIHAIAYRQSYAACDTRNYKYSIVSLINEGSNIKLDISKATNPWKDKNREKKAQKLAKTKEQLRAELVDWANMTFPNESEEFKNEKIEKVLNKQMKRYE